LAADLVENVDEMAFHIEQAKLENREQADGPRADNNNVSFNRLAHVDFWLVIWQMWVMCGVSSVPQAAGEEDAAHRQTSVRVVPWAAEFAPVRLAAPAF
jgi:hypothetical protein